MAIIAVSLTFTARLNLKARSNLSQSAEAAFLADGVIRLIAFRLANRNPTDAATSTFKGNGTVVHCRIDDHRVAFSITNTGGLVDLNAAPIPLLQMVLTAAGQSPEDAVRMAAAISDFRDTDDIPLREGAEASAYEAAGLPHGPKNAPFETVSELDQVIGMTPPLLARLRPLLTVHSRLPGIDPEAAPVALLTVMGPGPNRHAVGFALGQTNADPLRPSLSSGVATRSQTHTSVLRVRVRRQGGATAQREVVVGLAPRLPVGFMVHEWSSVPASYWSEPAQSTPSPDCAGGPFRP